MSRADSRGNSNRRRESWNTADEPVLSYISRDTGRQEEVNPRGSYVPADSHTRRKVNGDGAVASTSQPQSRHRSPQSRPGYSNHNISPRQQQTPRSHQYSAPLGQSSYYQRSAPRKSSAYSGGNSVTHSNHHRGHSNQTPSYQNNRNSEQYRYGSVAPYQGGEENDTYESIPHRNPSDQFAETHRPKDNYQRRKHPQPQQIGTSNSYYQRPQSAANSGQYSHGADARSRPSYGGQTTPHGGARHSQSQPQGGQLVQHENRQSRFRVRIHRAVGVFSEMEAAGRTAPTTAIVVHTLEERGTSGTSNDHNPVFNDEFIFHSSCPERDGLVCTLIALSSDDASRDKKVAECVVSLTNLIWRVEREVWVPMVRHSRTLDAYERGELLVSIFSDDFGADELPSEEEEAIFSEEVQRILNTYAPEDLHRLDWLVGEYLPYGDEGLNHIESMYATRTSPSPVVLAITQGPQATSSAAQPPQKNRGSSAENSVGRPVRLQLSVVNVSSLTGDDGAPLLAETCYVVITADSDSVQSQTVPYRNGRASFKEDFDFSLPRNSLDVAQLEVAVYTAGRKVGVALVGLANVVAGKPKQTTLMLVRAAETGDAANSGECTIVLRTNDYTSPFHMSTSMEERVRERVLAYLWAYLRDDLHRLDVIMAGIDDVDQYMQEWSRTVGPEPMSKHATINVRLCKDIFGSDNNKGGNNSNNTINNKVTFNNNGPCHVRVSVGPVVQRTDTSTIHNGNVTFNTPLDISVYDLHTDPVEVMLISEIDGHETEFSRVVLGVASLPRRLPVTRVMSLVKNAGTRNAKIQGEIKVEIVAQDFGITGRDAADAEANSGDKSKYYQSRLEAMAERSAPETLHRVPFMIDTTEPWQVEKMLSEKKREFGTDVVQSAPMTVRILGLRDFKPQGPCYVKAYLNGEAILRTPNVQGGASIKFDLDVGNESTVRLNDAKNSTVFFKIGQHRPLRKTLVHGSVELALGHLICGEKNVLWLPIYPHSAPVAGATAAGSSPGEQQQQQQRQHSSVNDEVQVQLINENRMPTAAGAGNRGAGLASNGMSGGATGAPLGFLGVQLQSMAFPVSTVTLIKSVDGEHDKPAMAVVTQDVTSLLSKYRPQDLPQVQPLISQCSSIKDAHKEMRAQYCPRPVDTTVYMHIDSIHMSTTEGMQLESMCGVAVSAIFGGEQQTSRKTSEFTNDAIRQKDVYPMIRLDLANPHTGSMPPLELHLLGVKPSRRNGGGAGSGHPAGGESSSSSSSLQKRHYSGDEAAWQRSRSVGGINNINNYIDTSGIADEVAHEKRDDHRNSNSNGRKSSAMFAHHQGDMGLVRLSLRALLTSQLHQIGDLISVPIIKSTAQNPPPMGRTSGTFAEGSQAQIVGQLTFHLSLPAFEVLPEWTKLCSREVLSGVEPAYIQYYARRVGAYLRENAPSNLIDLHYKIYERDVATGYWPVSIRNWLEALVKRFGLETTNRFGREPPLRFDPEEWERARMAEAARLHLDEMMVAGSVADDASSRARGHSGGKKIGNATSSLAAGNSTVLTPRKNTTRKSANGKQPVVYAF